MAGVNSVYAGNNALGQPCKDNLDCASGFCIENTVCGCTEDNDCPKNQFCLSGMCSDEKLDIGADCEEGNDCKSGYCVNKECRDSLLDEGEECSQDSDCKDDLNCVGGLCEAPQEQPQEDHQCSKDQASACQTKEECESSEGGNSVWNEPCGFCLDYRYMNAEERGYLGKDCFGFDNNCPDGQYCDCHTCKDKLTYGEDCSKFFGDAPVYMCETGLCGPLGYDGKYGCLCTKNSDCITDLEKYSVNFPARSYCHTDSGMCVEKGGVGTPCSSLSECKSGLSCKTYQGNEVCMKWCDSDLQCSDDEYCYESSHTGTKYCLKKGGWEDFCQRDEQCAEGFVCTEHTCQRINTNVPQKKSSTPTPPPTKKYSLPDFTKADHPAEVIGQIVKYIMGLVGSLALIMFIYGGLLWITSGAKEEKIKKGRDTLIWSGIGLALVMASYIIVKKIIELLGGQL